MYDTRQGTSLIRSVVLQVRIMRRYEEPPNVLRNLRRGRGNPSSEESLPRWWCWGSSMQKSVGIPRQRGEVCWNVWAIARHERKMPAWARGWRWAPLLCRDVWPPNLLILIPPHCGRREGAHEEKPTGKIYLMAAEEVWRQTRPPGIACLEVDYCRIWQTANRARKCLKIWERILIHESQVRWQHR